MSLVMRRTYSKLRKNTLSAGVRIVSSSRNYSDDKVNYYELSNSTILLETGFNVQELPIVIRKLRDVSDFENVPKVEHPKSTSESHNYHLIQAEFKQCMDLRDVFSLVTKCTKITPSIALGAIERIYDLEKIPTSIGVDIKSDHINIAKGAILEKLLKVVLKTEDTYTILNILKTVSTIIDPYKHKFCDELLIRVIDNRVTLDQLCDFTRYLINNNNDPKYSETIDKLWVGFIEKEAEIDENNIEVLFQILPGLKSSKRMILVLLEQKLSDIWYKIKISSMQDILQIFLQEKYFSCRSYAVVASWFNMNIHALNEDVLLDVLTKLTYLNYTDNQVEKAVEKYMKYKNNKITSYVLIVAVLNYCMQFQIRNQHILNGCSDYFIRNLKYIPVSFVKSFIYPYGFLNFDPDTINFWNRIEKVLVMKFDKINPDDLSLIALSFIYIGKHPLELVNKMFTSEYLTRVNKPDIMKRFYLIDTALSLESQEYPGPLLPKDHWLKPVLLDKRVKSILDKISDEFTSVAGNSMNVSFAVLVPNFCSDQTYLIDVLLHTSDFGNNLFNWKIKLMKNEVTAIVIHLPDHFCSDNETLIGPQVLRIKHLQKLGMKVVCLKYTYLSQFYTTYDKPALKKYIKECIESAL